MGMAPEKVRPPEKSGEGARARVEVDRGGVRSPRRPDVASSSSPPGGPGRLEAESNISDWTRTGVEWTIVGVLTSLSSNPPIEHPVVAWLLLPPSSGPHFQQHQSIPRLAPSARPMHAA
jgi:hypothetical protein